MAFGRPTKYSDKVIPKVLDFMLKQNLTKIKFKTRFYKGEPYEEEYEIGSPLPTVWLLAKHLEISVFTLHEWEKRYPDFSAALAEFRELQRHFLIQNTLRGFYKEQFAIFTMKNISDWTDTPKIKLDPKALSDEELLRYAKMATHLLETQQNWKASEDKSD